MTSTAIVNDVANRDQKRQIYHKNDTRWGTNERKAGKQFINKPSRNNANEEEMTSSENSYFVPEEEKFPAEIPTHKDMSLPDLQASGPLSSSLSVCSPLVPTETLSLARSARLLGNELHPQEREMSSGEGGRDRGWLRMLWDQQTKGQTLLALRSKSCPKNLLV